MAGCLENVQIPPCVWFEGDDKRNAIASIVAGVLVRNLSYVACQCIRFPVFPVESDSSVCRSFISNLFLFLIIMLQFFTGWWFIIDVQAADFHVGQFNKAYHVCGVFGTISLFM
jgi:hypothetical protein